MKVLFSKPIGGDGGKITAQLNGGNMEIVISYPAAAVLAPLKAEICGAIEKFIPGDYENGLVEGGFDSAIKALSEG